MEQTVNQPSKSKKWIHISDLGPETVDVWASLWPYVRRVTLGSVAGWHDDLE